MPVRLTHDEGEGRRVRDLGAEEEERRGSKQRLVGGVPRLSWKKPPVRTCGGAGERRLWVPDSGRRTPA